MKVSDLLSGLKLRFYVGVSYRDSSSDQTGLFSFSIVFYSIAAVVVVSDIISLTINENRVDTFLCHVLLLSTRL